VAAVLGSKADVVRTPVPGRSAARQVGIRVELGVLVVVICAVAV